MALQYILSMTSTCNQSCLIFISGTKQYKNIKSSMPPPHQKSKVEKIQLKTISLKRLYDRRQRRGSLRGWGGEGPIFNVSNYKFPLWLVGVTLDCFYSCISYFTTIPGGCSRGYTGSSRGYTECYRGYTGCSRGFTGCDYLRQSLKDT